MYYSVIRTNATHGWLNKTIIRTVSSLLKAVSISYNFVQWRLIIGLRGAAERRTGPGHGKAGREGAGWVRQGWET